MKKRILSVFMVGLFCVPVLLLGGRGRRNDVDFGNGLFDMERIEKVPVSKMKEINDKQIF